MIANKLYDFTLRTIRKTINMDDRITSGFNSYSQLYLMAASDDNFNRNERELLYEFAAKSGASISGLNNGGGNADSHLTMIPAGLPMRIQYLYDLASMILTDNTVSDIERSTLKKYCTKFKFREENIDELTNYLLECVRRGVTLREIISQLHSNL